jgi:hypothetical protein
VPRGFIDLQNPGIHNADSLQPLEYRACLQPFCGVFPLKEAFHCRRICLAPEIPHSGKDTPGLLSAHHLDDVTPKLPQGMQVVNHEPAAMQIHDTFAEPNHFFQSQLVGFHNYLSQNETVECQYDTPWRGKGQGADSLGLLFGLPNKAWQSA